MHGGELDKRKISEAVRPHLQNGRHQIDTLRWGWTWWDATDIAEDCSKEMVPRHCGLVCLLTRGSDTAGEWQLLHCAPASCGAVYCNRSWKRRILLSHSITIQSTHSTVVGCQKRQMSITLATLTKINTNAHTHTHTQRKRDKLRT